MEHSQLLNWFSGCLWGGGSHHEGWKLWLACLRGPLSIPAGTITWRKYFGKFHKSNFPNNGLQPFWIKQERRISIHHRRICLSIYHWSLHVWKVKKLLPQYSLSNITTNSNFIGGFKKGEWLWLQLQHQGCEIFYNCIVTVLAAFIYNFLQCHGLH